MTWKAQWGGAIFLLLSLFFCWQQREDAGQLCSTFPVSRLQPRRGRRRGDGGTPIPASQPRGSAPGHGFAPTLTSLMMALRPPPCEGVEAQLRWAGSAARCGHRSCRPGPENQVLPRTGPALAGPTGRLSGLVGRGRGRRGPGQWLQVTESRIDLKDNSEESTRLVSLLRVGGRG